MNNPKNLDIELNLREFWSILMKGKFVIFIITFLATFSSVIYTIKAAPIYSGSVLIEIGEVDNNNLVLINNQLTTIINFDNVYTLKEIILRIAEDIKPAIVGGTSNILQLSLEGIDKDKIKTKLNKAVNLIIERHQEKAKFYQNDHAKIRMTRIIGEITIKDEPIKPNKHMIIAVGFVSGLMLGIFVAFLKAFYTNRRKYFQSEHV